MKKYFFVLSFWALALSPAFADKVLILGTTVYGGMNSQEAQTAIALGYQVDVVTESQWAALSATDFAGYRAIILGDPACRPLSSIAPAEANRAVWSPVVNGNVIIIGTDPTVHSGGILIENGIRFAANQPDKTGLYLTLSCYYHGAPTGSPVPVLDRFGGFTIYDTDCYNQVHIVRTHPAMATLTDAALSGWDCSVHEGFQSWPSDFDVLAMAEGAGTTYTGPDLSTGAPYILVRGEGLLPVTNRMTLTPVVASNPTNSEHTVCAKVVTNGMAAKGVNVSFNITSGPNVGTSGTAPTDDSGVACFTYSGINGVGVDVITAQYTGTDGQVITSNEARKTWFDPCGSTILSASLIVVYCESNQVLLTFNEAVQASTATNPANYSLDQGLTVIGAEILPGSQPIVIVEADQNFVEGTTYTLQIFGVTDLCGRTTSPNPQSITFHCMVRCPEIVWPTNIVTQCEGPGGTAVHFEATVNPLCTNAYVIYFDHPSDSTFHGGTTVVHGYLGNAGTNAFFFATNTFTVTVIDPLPPLIDCPSNIVVYSCTNVSVPFPINVEDNCSTNISLVCTPPSKSVFMVGTTTPVHCVATDEAGNTNSCDFTVTVLPPVPPVFLASPSDFYLCIESNGCGTMLDFTGQVQATNNYGGDAVVTQNISPGTSICSDTTVTFTVADGCGNSSSVNALCHLTNCCIRFQPQSNIVVSACTNVAVYYSPTATDTCCSNLGVVCAPPSGSFFGPGTTVVSCVATDSCGNSSSISFTVTVSTIGLIPGGNKTVTQSGCLLGNGLPVESDLYAFTGQEGSVGDGNAPFSGLLLASDGKLYGTTTAGGASGNNGGGTVFRLNTDGSGYQILHSFSGNDGSDPMATLIEGSDGRIYGTTAEGGPGSGAGTVFKMNSDGSAYTILHTFVPASGDGAQPGGLIQGSDGKLYGTTSQNGNGKVFKLNTDGTGYTILYNFQGPAGNDGWDPTGTLIQGADGVLYGTTFEFASSVAGSVFKLNTDGTGYAVLHLFSQTDDGVGAISGLVQGTDGKLYGTAELGGLPANKGSLYKLNTDGTGFSVLYKFGSTPNDGGNVFTGLAQGCDGALYGNSRIGLYKLNPDGTGFTMLYRFSEAGDSSGSYNYGRLAVSDNAIYAAAFRGGSHDAGKVVKLEWTSFDTPLITNSCCSNVTLTVLSTVTNSGPCPTILTRTWLATDDCGGSNTASQTIIIYPTNGCGQSHQFQCPSNIVVDCTNDTGYVVYFPPTIDGLPAHYSPASGSVFLIGTTPVSCTVTNGNTPVTCVFDVVVRGHGDALGRWIKTDCGRGPLLRGNAIAVDNNGNAFVGGEFSGTVGVTNFCGTNLASSTGHDAFLAKYDTYGNVLWVRRIIGDGDEAARGVAVDSQGNCFVVGSFGGTVVSFVDPAFNISLAMPGEGNGDIFLAKYDATGKPLWAKVVGGPGGDNGEGVVVDTNDNCYITGVFSGTADFDGATATSSSADCFVAKWDAAGTFQWVTNSAGSASHHVEARSIMIDNLHGAAFVTGIIQTDAHFGNNTALTGGGQFGNAFVAKLTLTNGAPRWEWSRQLTCNTNCGSEDGIAIGVDNAGNSYFTAYYDGTAIIGGAVNLKVTDPHPGLYDYLVGSYTPSGAARWIVRGAVGGDDEPRGLAVNAAAGYVYVAGFQSGANSQVDGGRNMYLTEYDLNGNLRWNQLGYGSSQQNVDAWRGVALDRAGCVYLAGSHTDNSLTFYGFVDGVHHFSASSGMTKLLVAKYCPACSNCVPATIVSPLQNALVTAGPSPANPVSFTAVADGTAPLQLQWARNGLPLITGPFTITTSPEGKTSTLTLTGVPGGGTYDNGLYSVAFWNQCCDCNAISKAYIYYWRIPPLANNVSPAANYQLSILAPLGVPVRIEYRDDLNDGTPWQYLTNLVGTGTDPVIFDPNPNPVMRFYQVPLQPDE